MSASARARATARALQVARAPRRRWRAPGRGSGARAPRLRARLLAGAALLWLPTGAGAAPPRYQAAPGAAALPAALVERLERVASARELTRTRHRRSDGSPRYVNRLLLESSPYLRQRAHDPIQWYPWGDEAFEAARRLGRPVLLGIGFSTCHACHVMEDETFDDLEIARLVNRDFIAIQIDREARPDLDALYLGALELLAPPAGWPALLFLTPEREPFLGGGYLPPRGARGRPAFRELLGGVQAAWSQGPGRVREMARSVTDALRAELETRPAERTAVLSAEPLREATSLYLEAADREFGGIWKGSKFPSTLPVRLLLRVHRRTGDARVLALARLTLERMASGALRDPLGGGFHRYTTDRRWLEPRFEKMLYDQAQLALAYLEGWQHTGLADLAEIARETLRFTERELGLPGGGFAAALDADSEISVPRPPGAEPGIRREGGYYTWAPVELSAVLGASDAALLAAVYGLDGAPAEPRPLQRRAELEQVARSFGIPPADLRFRLERARDRLLAARGARPRPFRDESVLASWNGLAISAFARAGFALGDPELLARAALAADFVLGRMRDADGRLLRTWLGGRAEGAAFLEDYACMIQALLDLFEATGEPDWLERAVELQAIQDRHYADARDGGYFRTADFHEALLAREKPRSDGDLPSGNSVAAHNLLRLHQLTGRATHAERAALLFSALAGALERDPTALAELLAAVDFALDSRRQVVVVEGEVGGQALLAALRPVFMPNATVALVRDGPGRARLERLMPAAAHKPARAGRATAYVCEDRVCALPTSDPELLRAELARARGLPDPGTAPATSPASD